MMLGESLHILLKSHDPVLLGYAASLIFRLRGENIELHPDSALSPLPEWTGHASVSSSEWAGPVLEIRQQGVFFDAEQIPAGEGRVWCGGDSELPLPSPERVVEEVLRLSWLPEQQPLLGKRLLMTAGPTMEDVDPARFVSNRSTGTMGTAIARMAARMGASVVLVHGPMQASIPDSPQIQAIPVRSAQQMLEAVLSQLPSEIAILCAAVADFRPVAYSPEKIKKTGDDLFLMQMCKNPDILAHLGELEQHPYLVGFAAESQYLREHALDKLRRKRCELICANNILVPGCGFGTGTNALTIYGADGSVTEIAKAPKLQVATELLQLIAQKYHA